MSDQQAGADQGADPRRIPVREPRQMTAPQPTLRAPVQAAFGSGGGAALVFRDFASI